jgi:hypothetical protein
VQLQVSPPQDTGGLPILGYAIIRQENWLGAYTDAVIAPVTRADTQHIDVAGLVPATGYMYGCLLAVSLSTVFMQGCHRFKIAAINAAGVSSFSDASNGVTTEITGGCMILAWFFVSLFQQLYRRCGRPQHHCDCWIRRCCGWRKANLKTSPLLRIVCFSTSLS